MNENNQTLKNTVENRLIDLKIATIKIFCEMSETLWKTLL